MSSSRCKKGSNLSIMSLSCFRALSLSVSIILINCDAMSDSTILFRVERMFWLTVFFEVTDLTGTCFLLLLLVEEASSPILESTVWCIRCRNLVPTVWCIRCRNLVPTVRSRGLHYKIGICRCRAGH